MSSRVIIFDDNKNITDSVAMLLSTSDDFELVGMYAHAQNCIEVVRKKCPHFILMDIEMPGMDGIEATALLKQEFPHIPILMQTVFEDDERVFNSICAGALGYILKNHLNTQLISALNELQYGGSPMSPSIARKILFRMQQIPQHIKKKQKTNYHLSPREKEVLQLIVEGFPHKMIAANLNISYETVRSHVKNIYEKLHVASLTEAVAKAINKKIID